MINVAIDGPSAAGKSQISRLVAKEMNYVYIDTGAMFRSLGLKALENNIDIKNDTESVCGMLSETTLDIRRENGEQKMILDGRDVTELIRTPEVSVAASDIAVIPSVRDWILVIERSLASKYDCVMDGRDIGTSVLPDADVKIFLTASAEKRAERRFAELKQKGIDTDYASVLKDMIYRDEQDANRKVSPLKKADDAIVADTTDLTFDESVSRVLSIVRKVTANV